MRGVQRVTEEHDAVPVPPRVFHERKIEPPHEIVREERVAVEMFREDALEETAGIAVLHRVQPRGPPRRFAAFDNERAAAAIELVRVRGEEAFRCLDERQREPVKQLRRAEPDVLVPAVRDGRLEQIGIGAPDEAVCPVRADEQIGRGQFLDCADGMIEPEIDAQLEASPLQDLQECQPRDTGEPVAADRHSPAAMDDVDVVPCLACRRDSRVRRPVVLAQVIERLIGEDDPPAERVAGAVPLEDRDVVRRIALFHQQREIQPRGSAADHDDVEFAEDGDFTGFFNQTSSQGFSFRSTAPL